MGESAHVAIVTTFNAFRVSLAELDLIFLGVVEFLDSVVGSGTIVA